MLPYSMDYNYLLNNPPKSYTDTRTISPTRGASGICIIRGRVSHLMKKDRFLSATVTDSTGSIQVVFFSHNNYHGFHFKVGSVVTLMGNIKDSEMIHPKILTADDVGIIKAVYKKGMTRRGVKRAIEQISARDDIVPECILKKRGLPDLKETLRMLHFPKSMEEVELARWRLAYTELYAELVSVESPPEGISISFPQDTQDDLTGIFPFRLTECQMRAVSEILNDLRSPKAMRRILVGDVGSGKTEVAIAAIYATVLGGYRVLYLCPTEILAIQTYQRIARALAGKAYTALYTSSEKVKKATPDVIVGTHALLYNGWQYHKIGLTIIDEQHKFGVKQREKLVVTPECNLLEITATPIPRSYAMFMQSIMDVSMLDRLPFERAVDTRIIAKDDYDTVLRLISEEVNKGKQALIVYASVEAEKNNMKAAKKAYIYWQQKFKEATDLLYGGIKDKESILTRFARGDISVLVSTTASEVGIDVPNLTVCVVVNAERFGLAQLHQIRGRVGRRGHKGYFFLICKNDSSRERLEPLLRLNNGCDIAEADMRKRGPGIISGEAQAGHFFRYFSLNDVEIAALVKEDIEDARKYNSISERRDATLSPCLKAGAAVA